MSASATSLGTLVIELTGESMAYRAMWRDAERMTETSSASIVQSVTHMSVAAIAALAAVGSTAVYQFAQFDEAMTESLAIMEDISAGTRKEMEMTARSIALNTRTSATGAAQAYLFLASAGWNAAQSMKALPGVAKFASAANIDMSRATDLLTNSQTALGLASKDAEQNLANLIRVSDTLTHAANISNASADDLATSLRTKVAASARLLGKDVEEVVAVLGAYADQGIKAEYAGEQLSQMMRDTQNSAIEQKEIWADYGLAVFDSAGKVRPLVDIISDLEKVTASYTDRQKTLLFTQLGFQDRSVAAIKALLGTSDKIREYERELRSAGGATEEVAKKQLSSFNAQLDITKNRVTDAFITIGEQLTPSLRELNSVLGDSEAAQSGFNDAAQTTGDIISGSVTGAIGTLANIWYGWNAIVTAGTSIFITLAGVFKYVTMAGQTGFLALGAVIEAVFRGWQKLGITTFYGIKSTFTEFLIWAREKQIAAAEMMNSLLPESKQYTADWFAPLRQDIIKWSADLTKMQRDQDNAMAGTTSSFGEALQKQVVDFNAFRADMNAEQDAFSLANKELWKGFWEEAGSSMPYDFLTGKFREVAKETAAVVPAVTAVTAAVVEQTNAVGSLTTQYTKLSPEVKALLTQIQYPWKAGLVELKKYDQMLADTAITEEEYQRAKYALNLKGDAEDPMEKAINDVVRLKDQMKDGVISAEEYEQAVRNSLMGASPFFDESGGGQIAQLEAQSEALRKQYELQRTIAVDSKKLTNEQLLAMDKAYAVQTTKIAMDIRATQLTMANTLLDSAGAIASGLEGLAKEGSAAQKAFFLASKGIAIAQAIVNTELAATRALAEGGIVAGIPMASWIRAMGYASAGIIAAQAIASFEGGGMMPDGPRTGGVDGRGGKLAVLHPNEKVTDLTKQRDVGSGVNINIINNAGAQTEVQRQPNGDIDIIIERAADRAISKMAPMVRTGGNALTSALEQTYKVRRGS